MRAGMRLPEPFENEGLTLSPLSPAETAGTSSAATVVVVCGVVAALWTRLLVWSDKGAGLGFCWPSEPGVLSCWLLEDGWESEKCSSVKMVVDAGDAVEGVVGRVEGGIVGLDRRLEVGFGVESVDTR
jgi:hypothetical protein